MAEANREVDRDPGRCLVRVSHKPPKKPFKMMTVAQRAELAELLEKRVANGAQPIGKFVKEMAKRYDKTEDSIWIFVRKLRDTTTLARSYFRANAWNMAKRVVKKGSVAEHIDILQRPNIGVLAPMARNDGPSGLFISVSALTCGAVADPQKISNGGIIDSVKQIGSGKSDAVQVQSANEGGVRRRVGSGNEEEGE